MTRPKSRPFFALCLLLYGLLLIQHNSLGQNLKVSQWRFGSGAGLDFTNGSAQVVPIAHPMFAFECAGSMADVNGNLLFYTNGLDVYNSSNVIMPNGAGLGGSMSAAQLVVVGRPGNSDQYYIVTPTVANLSYSLVDMSLAGGDGDVVAGQKAVVLESSFGQEQVTAVNHSNGQDVWILYNKNGQFPDEDTICSTLLTAGGFVNPVNKITVDYTLSQQITSMTASPVGNYVTVAGFQVPNSFTELFTFDASTGSLSNPIRINRQCIDAAYSCDGQVLYLSAGLPGVFQYDLSSGDSLTIVNSEVSLGTLPYTLSQFQLAPDGKIYGSNSNNSTVSVIHSPKTLGIGCDLQIASLNVSPGISQIGMPGFNQSCLICSPAIEDSIHCATDTTFFTVNNLDSVDSIRWYFGNPASVLLNTDTGKTTAHVYPHTGFWQVQAITYFMGISDSLQKTIYIDSIPTVDLGPDLILCSSDTVTITPTTQYADTFSWSTGGTDTFLLAAPTNTYSITVSNACGAAFDSVLVDTLLPINIDLGPDTVVCFGDTAWLSVPSTLASTLWSTGSNADSIQVTQAGTYWLAGSNSCTSDTDTVVFQLDTIPVLSIGSDTVLCEGDSIDFITGNIVEASFLWHNGSSDSTFQVLQAGQIWLQVSNHCGSSADTLVVDSLIPALVHLEADTILCPGDSLVLDGSVALGSYIWQNNNTAATQLVTTTGTYWCTASNLCGTDSDTMQAYFLPLPMVDLGPDTLACFASPFTVFASDTMITSVLWQDGSNADSLVIDTTGSFHVTLQNICGSGSDTLDVIFTDPPSVNLGVDTLLCPGGFISYSLNEPYSSYFWYSGATDSSITVSSATQVWVEATNLCGTSSDTVQVNMEPYPFVYLGNDTAICENDSATLVANFPGAGYLWFNNSSDSVQVIYDAGYYWVEVNNACGTFTDSIQVNVDDSLIFDFGPDTTICSGDSLLLSTFLSEEYPHFWQNASDENSFLVIYQGNYWVLVSNACGQNSDTIVVAIAFPPEVDLINLPVLCDGDSAVASTTWPSSSYLWNTSETDSAIVLKQAGTYSVTVTNQCGAASDSITLVLEDSLVLSLGPDLQGCLGTPLWLQASPIRPVNWFDGYSADSIAVDTSGTYWASDSNVCGLVSDTVEVSFAAVPQLSLGNDTSFCEGDSALIVPAGNLNNMEWLDGSPSGERWILRSGIYQAQSQNYCGITEVSVTVQTQQVPSIQLGANRQICVDEPEILYGPTGMEEYLWQDGSSSSSLLVSQPGSYVLQVWDDLGCTDSASVQLIPCPSLWVPNAFTPRGDQLNEIFKPVGENLHTYRFRVYNRWGQLLFETNDQEKGWNGFFDGKQAPVGAYVWDVFFIDRSGKEKLQTGSFQLIR